MGLYQQMAAVLGAFSMAAYFGHLLGLGWRGALKTIVGFWDETVRPFTGWLAKWCITAPFHWAFGWHVTVPEWVRDYFAVGVILFMSEYRVLNQMKPYLRLRLFWSKNRPIFLTRRMLLAGILRDFRSWILVWPFELVAGVFWRHSHAQYPRNLRQNTAALPVTILVLSTP